MINPDINRFLGTLLYPVADVDLLFDDPFDSFFAQLPTGFIISGKEKDLNRNREKVFFAAAKFIARRFTLDSYDQIFQYMKRWYMGQAAWRSQAGESLYSIIFHRLC